MMDGEYWAAPVWSSRSLSAVPQCATYCYPDSENVGLATVVGTRGQPHLSSSGKNFILTRSKILEAKFPLTKTLPFAYPLLDPVKRKVIQDRNYKINSSVSNCLGTLSLGGRQYVVHPVQKSDRPQKITFSRLVPSDTEGKEGQRKGSYLPKLKREISVPTEKNIQQLVCQPVINKGYILHRSETEVQFISLCDRSEGFVSFSDSICSDSQTSDVAMSSVLPGVWSLACADGCVYLYEVSSHHSLLWQANFSIGKSKTALGVYQCSFGDHPCSLLVGNASDIWLCDTRKPFILSKDENMSENQTVFSVNGAKKCLKNCRDICSFLQVYASSYLYVVTEDSVYVVDQRNDSMPVLQWCHMILTKPSFFITHRTDDLDFILVTDRSSHKVGIMANQWISDVAGKRCQGVSLPKHFQIQQDTIEFAHEQDLWFNHQVTERLSSQWTGIATYALHHVPSAISFLSLSANGDIFSQDFHLSQEACSPILDDPLITKQQGKSILSKWEKEVIGAEMSDLSKEVYIGQYYNASPFFKNINSKNIPCKPMGTNGGFRSESKCIKNNRVKDFSESENIKLWDVRKQVQEKIKKKRGKTGESAKNETGHIYWVNSLLDNYKATDDLPNKPDSDVLSPYMPHELVSSVQPKKLMKYKDHLATQIFSLWQENNSEANGQGLNDSYTSSVSSPVTYHTAPFNTKQLKFLPSKLQEGDAQQYANLHTQTTTNALPSSSQYQVPDLDLSDLLVPSVGPSQDSQKSRKPSRINTQSSQMSSQVSQVSKASSRRLKLLDKKLRKKRMDGF